MSKSYYDNHLKNNFEYKKNKSEYDRLYRERNKEKIKQKGLAYREKNKERLKSEKAEYFQNNKQKMSDKWNRDVLKYRYGLTPQQYDKILASQNGVCAICGKFRLAKNQKRMGVDHCHDTEKVRGILCNWCNDAIGKLNNIETIEKAIAYLKINGDNLDIGQTIDATVYSIGTRGMKYLKRKKTKQNDSTPTKIVPLGRAV